MIKHHPNHELLLAFATGDVSLSMALAISAHCELCSDCTSRVSAMQQRLASHFFPTIAASKANKSPSAEPAIALESLSDSTVTVMDNHWQSEPWQDMDGLFDSITCQAAITTSSVNPRNVNPPTVNLGSKDYLLPNALRQFASSSTLASPWSSFGNVSRMRLNTDDGKTRVSLLHIKAGGEIPAHTHKGQEITLLLEGHFSDEYGTYGPGDFMSMNGQNHHSPTTIDGCLCLTVVDAPLHFTKGLPQLLNPLGQLIY